jgi:hypothetical protein
MIKPINLIDETTGGILEKGESMTIQGVKVYIPPVGYIPDAFNPGKLIYIGVQDMSNEEDDYYWLRQGLPDDYLAKRNEERKRQSRNPLYIDNDLEVYRQRMWLYRLGGFWFYNTKRQKPIYITGMHWLYLEWMYIGCERNNGYPDFRDADKKFFYFLEHCIQNPNCFGLVYVTKRRQGKSAKSVVFALDAFTRQKFANVGIQSKSAQDAKEVVFRDGIIRAFQKLPDFFMPKYDTTAGISPTSELKLLRPSKRGRQDLEADDYLGGICDWRAGSEISYDGTKLRRYIGDEIFKTSKEVDIYERWRVVKFCLLVDGKVYGKAMMTSTVEEIEGATENYIKFWNDSDQESLHTETKQTKTGLYRYYLSADESRNFDKYGMCNIEANRKQILSERSMYADDPVEYNSLVRKESLSIEEAFRVVSSSSTFDTIKLNNQLDNIAWQEEFYVEEGNLVLKNDSKEFDISNEIITTDNYVEWVPKKGGKYKRVKNFPHPDGQRLFRVESGGYVSPLSKHLYTSGNDPFDHSGVQSKRHQSKGAFYIYAKYDPMNAEKSDMFIMQYIGRPKTAEEFYDDYMLALLFYGCQGLVENSRIGLIQYFKRNKLQNMLVWVPGRKEPGIPGHAKTNGAIAQVTEQYISAHCDKVYFQELIKDWIQFDVDNTQKFDPSMAAGYTLLSNKDFYIGKSTREKPKQLLSINDIFG